MATITFPPSPIVGTLHSFGSPVRTWRCKVAAVGANEWERVINQGQTVSIFNHLGPVDDHVYLFPFTGPGQNWTLLHY